MEKYEYICIQSNKPDDQRLVFSVGGGALIQQTSFFFSSFFWHQTAHLTPSIKISCHEGSPLTVQHTLSRIRTHTKSIALYAVHA